MDWLTDELLFYGGLSVAGAALLLGVACCCVFWAAGVRLKAKMETEYGKDPYGKGKRKKKVRKQQNEGK